MSADDLQIRSMGLSADAKVILTVTPSGQFIWHDDAERLIASHDNEPLIHILTALWGLKKQEGLTDEQIEAIAHRKCTSYEHVPHDLGIKYSFAPHHMIDCARAVIAAARGAK